MSAINQIQAKTVIRIVLFIALVIALLFTVSFVFGCGTIPFPGWCDLYYEVMRAETGGQPQVLILYGQSGMGNPNLLEQELTRPTGVRARVTSIEIDRATAGLLEKYDLVIVERAKEMSSQQIKMIVDYVNRGGRLIWTGDAGTRPKQKPGETKKEAEKREFLLEFEDPQGDSNSEKPVNPWARKFEGKIVRLDEILSAKYLGNYCDPRIETEDGLKSICTGPDAPFIGNMRKIALQNKLINELREGKVYGDMAIVQVAAESLTTLQIMDVETMGPVTGLGTQQSLPLIIQSGFGGKVIYYAMPLSQFVDIEIFPMGPEGYYLTYPSIIEKAYYAMLR
jgi:hypothetical protein